MSVERTTDEYRAALEAAGWGTTFRITFHPHGREWVAVAVKGDRAVERRGASPGEAWRAVYERALREAPAEG
jgi:hypothetical protein